MAAAQAVQRAPEIVIVNDGKPVESVERKSKAVRFGLIAGIALVPLIAGIAVGQISHSAKTYNKTIEDAAVLAEDMKRVRRSLQEVHDALLLAKERGPGGQSFVPNDKKLTEALAAIDLNVIDPTVAYHSHLYEMKPEIVESVLDFYAQTSHLARLVQAHVTSAQQDEKVMSAAIKQREDGNADPSVNAYGGYKYAVYYSVPTKEEAAQGAMSTAKLVEIGPPICQDRKASSTGSCQGAPIGFGYRATGPGDGWTLMEIFQPQGGEGEIAIPDKKLLPLAPTQTLEGLLKGSEGTVAELHYMDRLKQIDELAGPLLQFGSDVEKKLQAKAAEGKKFTFFM